MIELPFDNPKPSEKPVHISRSWLIRLIEQVNLNTDLKEQVDKLKEELGKTKKETQRQISVPLEAVPIDDYALLYPSTSFAEVTAIGTGGDLGRYAWKEKSFINGVFEDKEGGRVVTTAADTTAAKSVDGTILELGCNYILNATENSNIFTYTLSKLGRTGVVNVTSAMGGGGVYKGKGLKRWRTSFDATTNLTTASLGEFSTDENMYVLNLTEKGQTTHDIINRKTSEHRTFNYVQIGTAGDNLAIVTVQSDCCLDTCCNIICVEYYPGGGADNIFYSLPMTVTDEVWTDGTSMIYKSDPNWVLDFGATNGVYTAPLEGNSCPPTEFASWTYASGGTSFRGIKCGACDVSDCCASICVTTDWEESAVTSQLVATTPGLVWDDGAGTTITKVDTNWVLIVGGSTYTAPVTGNPCPPLVKASWTLTVDDDILYSLACEECPTLYRQARTCDTDDLANVWMTVADATAVGVQAFKIIADADGKCYHFSAGDSARITPGAVYAFAAVTTFADCEECEDTEPCCDPICVSTETANYSLAKVDATHWSDGGTTTIVGDGLGGWTLTVEGATYTAAGYYNCPPTTFAEWAFATGVDVLIEVACGECCVDACYFLGATNTVIFPRDGVITLHCNDEEYSDNSGTWDVTFGADDYVVNGNDSSPPTIAVTGGVPYFVTASGDINVGGPGCHFGPGGNWIGGSGTCPCIDGCETCPGAICPELPCFTLVAKFVCNPLL